MELEKDHKIASLKIRWCKKKIKELNQHPAPKTSSVLTSAATQALKANAKEDNQKAKAILQELEILFHHASAGKYGKVCNILKSNPALGSASDNDGNTVVHTAATTGQLDVLKAILDLKTNLKIDINATNKEGNTALHLAAIDGQSKVAAALIAGGADYTQPNKNGHTVQYIIFGENVPQDAPTLEDIAWARQDTQIIAELMVGSQNANYSLEEVIRSLKSFFADTSETAQGMQRDTLGDNSESDTVV